MCGLGSYRVTLNINKKNGNEEEGDVALKACHKRCAERTLKVLELNGSIFIKLGTAFGRSYAFGNRAIPDLDRVL